MAWGDIAAPSEAFGDIAAPSSGWVSADSWYNITVDEKFGVTESTTETKT